jgi:hypothetical protein
LGSRSSSSGDQGGGKREGEGVGKGCCLLVCISVAQFPFLFS